MTEPESSAGAGHATASVGLPGHAMHRDFSDCWVCFERRISVREFGHSQQWVESNDVFGGSVMPVADDEGGVDQTLVVGR